MGELDVSNFDSETDGITNVTTLLPRCCLEGPLNGEYSTVCQDATERWQRPSVAQVAMRLLSDRQVLAQSFNILQRVRVGSSPARGPLFQGVPSTVMWRGRADPSPTPGSLLSIWRRHGSLWPRALLQ